MLDIGPLVMGGTRFTQQSKSIVFNMGKKKERKKERERNGIVQKMMMMMGKEVRK